MSTYQELNEKASKLLADVTKLRQANQGANWTQEGENNIAAMLDEVDRLAAQASNEKRLAELSNHFDAPAGRPAPMSMVGNAPATKSAIFDDEAESKAVSAGNVFASPQYDRAFKSYLNSGGKLGSLSAQDLSMLQRGEKTLNTNSGSAGGYLASTTYLTTLVEEAAEMSKVYNAVSKQTGSGDAIEVPTVQGNSTYAGIYPNGIVATYVNSPTTVDAGDTEPTFGQLRMPFNDLVLKTRAALRLVRDPAVNLEAALRRWYATAYGLQRDKDILTGTGLGEPLGILSDSVITGTYYVQTASSGVIVDDDLQDLVYNLPAQYASDPSCAFVMKRSTVRLLAKLKDAEDRYIWQPGLQLGQPSTLLGYPILESSFMPTSTNSAYPIIFGAMQYYTYGEGPGIAFQVVAEKYVEQLKVGFMAWFQTAGMPTVQIAFRVLKVKA